MSGSVLVSQTRHDGGGCKSESSDNGSGPLDGDEIDSLSIRDGSRDASNGFSIRVVDEHLDLSIDIGESVSNAWNCTLGVGIDDNIERVVEVARAHGTKALEAIASSTRVDRLSHDFVAVGGDGEVEKNIALDSGRGGHVDRQRIVVGRVDDIEQTGGEAGVGDTGTERGGVESVLGGDGGDEAQESERSSKCSAV